MLRPHWLDTRLADLDEHLATLRPGLPAPVVAALDRWRSDAAACRFHLRDDAARHPPLVAILGGTGTGKSTLTNRLLDANCSATSFRRTYTAGAVAVVASHDQLPAGWLGVDHHPAEALPARGQPDQLFVATTDAPFARQLTLVDTPDLDGDQPLHHVQADRAFRWAQVVLFVVTPEKYQMTELLPYYRLARRYHVPSLFVMNKCEESAVLDDYARQLAGRDWPDARLFAVPRDDAAWSPPPGADLAALRDALTSVPRDVPLDGVAHRATDLAGRLIDQLVAPLRRDRAEAERLATALRQMEAPEPGVDVNPITQQLQRRLQQRSVLYLMGPGRMIERVRQVPGLLVRLPRTLWDAVIRGKTVTLNDPASAAAAAGDSQVPDFAANLSEQFAVVQSRIDDALRSSPVIERWLADRPADYQAVRLDPTRAGQIAHEELAALREWLEKRWDAKPRDTVLLLRLLRYLPGGERIVAWTEATPYLLALVVAAHGALFGHLDLMIIGGFSLATWLTEKLSNEVTTRVRQSNRRITERFAELAHEQIENVCAYLAAQAPPTKSLDAIERLAEEIAKASDEATERRSDEEKMRGGP